MAYLERVTGASSNSSQPASTISQRWESDARKDPEEEYFRLVSGSHYPLHISTWIVTYSELLGAQNYLQRARYGLCIHGLSRKTLCQVQKAKDTFPSLVLLDREGANQSQRDAKKGSRSLGAP